MNDAVLVRGFERLSDLGAQSRAPRLDGIGPLPEAIGERRPIDELEHEGLGSVRFLKAMDSGECSDG